MRQLKLALRSIERPRQPGVSEAEFQQQEHHVQLVIADCALVLVDVWDSHYITSHQLRCENITERIIRPLVDAARKQGLCVIHAPGPEVAAHYRQCPSFGRSKTTRWFGQPELPGDWPPTQNSEHHLVAGLPPPPPLPEAINRMKSTRKIHPALTPRQSEPVVADYSELHNCLTKRQTKYLFYAGFAANICLPYRDYGMRAMQAAGYKVIMLRDATTALEIAATLDAQALLTAAILDIELNYGATASAGNLQQALNH